MDMIEAATVAGGVPSREVPRPAPAERKPRGGRFVLAVPLVLVNASAVWGQAGWAFGHITDTSWPALARWALALAFAGAIESIGVYLAWEAHDALLSDQASFGLRSGSYAIGGLAGILNYLHFSESNSTAGVAFGALSAISPWLWATWSRARNRTRLTELGLADARAVRLSGARRLWHPIRSIRVTSWAAWAGVTDPRAAVAGWTAATAHQDPQDATQELPAVPGPARHSIPAGDVVKALTEPTARERIRGLRDEHPEWTQNEIAEAADCTARWVRHVLGEEQKAG